MNEIYLKCKHIYEIDNRELFKLKEKEKELIRLKTMSVIGEDREGEMCDGIGHEDAHLALNKEKYERNLELAYSDSRARLMKVAPGWTEIAPPHHCDESEIGNVRRLHKLKMEKMRAGKDWLALVATDDVDMAGDRILAEIKNYKEETMYDGKFYN